MQVAGRENERASAPDTSRVNTAYRRSVPWLFGLFTLAYFGRTLLRASAKAFWYDELCTFYTTALPTFAQSWAAVRHGLDFNPPLFHLIHRGFRALFGDGQIALRLPEIIAFYIFCVCLFRFMSKTAGPIAGLIAMALPMLTGAYYYATEARPYALVLGCLGVALVCWQNLQQKPDHWGWRIAFAAALEIAYLNHCYALLLVIPFGLAELWYAIRERDIRHREWLTLFVPAAIAAVSYLPLLQSYHAVLGNTGVGAQFSPKLSRVFDFYTFALAPCWLLVLAAVALYAMRSRSAKAEQPACRPRAQELVLTLGLIAVPLFGLPLASALHAQFFHRYVLGASAGCVLLVAFALSCKSSRLAALVATVIVLYVAAQFAQTARLRHKGVADFMVEPDGSDFVFSRNPSDPLEEYALLRKQMSNNQPVIVHSILDFLYLVHYAPEWKSRLYSVSAEPDIPYKLERAAREWCHVDFNREELLDEFLGQHSDFAVYGSRSEFPLLESMFQHRGAQVASFEWGDNSHFLARVHAPARP